MHVLFRESNEAISINIEGVEVGCKGTGRSQAFLQHQRYERGILLREFPKGSARRTDGPKYNLYLRVADPSLICVERNFVVGTMIGASQNLRGRGSQTFDGFFSNVRDLTAIERDLHRSSQNGLNSGFGVKGEGGNAVGTSCTFLESVCEMAVARRLPVTLEASQVQLGCLGSVVVQLHDLSLSILKAQASKKRKAREVARWISSTSSEMISKLSM